MIVVIHYGEIALKGGNREMFEDKLVGNIKKTLNKNRVVFKSVKKPYGRIVVEFDNKTDAKDVENCLNKVFGITHFSFAYEAEKDIEKIKEKAVEILREKDFETFKVETKRSNKNFALTSPQVNQQIGEEILNNFYSGDRQNRNQNEKREIKVDLENPDVILFIEIADKLAYIYTEKIKGLGGLPLGVSGKATCLISGGIDSPVASFSCMKRGVEIAYLHFHSFPQTNQASIDKVKDLIKVLNKYQAESKVYLVPFIDIQKEILLNTKDSLRVVLYRRFMLRIAEELAKTEKAFALITGESIGQVASQTLPNIAVIEECVKIPLLRPLIGYDKQDIIEKAREIGTYEISIAPHQDCCSVFLPKSPETKASLKEVEKEESKLDIEKLIKSALKNTQTEII